MTFRPKFIITGLTESRRDKELEKVLTETFMALRHLVIQDLNPRYEGWNNEFVDIFGTRNDYYNDEGYRKFMSDRQNEILKKYDGIYKGFSMRADEYCDLVGIYNHRTKHVKIALELIPI